MKTRSLLTFVLAFAAAAAAGAADQIVAGPKGGRLLATEPHAAEFFVTAEGKAEITFYDTAGQPVARGTQAVTVTAEPAGGRARVELVPTPHGFVSVAPLPEGGPYRVVVQVRATPEARPQNFRLDLNTAVCGGCDRAEYACTCAH
jgi:hypothetical protein